MDQPVTIDANALYQELRSSKQMKRKWRDSETARKAKPKPAPTDGGIEAFEGSDESGDEEEGFGDKWDYY